MLACVCGRREGGGGLVSVSEPPCMFVFVIRVAARRFSLPKDKNDVLKSWNSLQFSKSTR